MSRDKRYFGLISVYKPKKIHIGDENWEPLCNVKYELHCEGEIKRDTKYVWYWLGDDVNIPSYALCTKCFNNFNKRFEQ